MEMELKGIAKRKYEVTFISLEDNISFLEPALQKHGAEARNEESRTTKVRLEFPIKKQEYGFFGVLVFEIAPEKISPLEADFRLSDKLLRFMITTYQPPKKEPEKKPVESFRVESEKKNSFVSEKREKREYEKSAKKEVLDEESSENEDADILKSFAAVASSSLTNEDLERKIEEILQ